jgi:hypothetical protein
MQQQHAQQSPHLKGQGQGSPHTIFFDRKVDLITAGLQPRYNKYLEEERQISRENALIICDYILSMKTEINPSNEYRKTTIQVLIQFLKFLPKLTKNHSVLQQGMIF